MIDFKIDELTHQDLGQMQMYVNYYDRYEKIEGENPTIGILLCKQSDEALVDLTLPENANIYAKEYKLYLPDKKLLQKKLKEWLDEEQTQPNYNRDIHRVILNKDFDKYEFAWNEYCVDGLSGLGDIVRDSALYTAVTNGEINCSPTLPEIFDDNAAAIAPPSGNHANRKILNYICPPDLYYYCTNGSNMVVNGVFSGSGRPNDDPTYDYFNYGVRGRIAPNLFKPIRNATDLSLTFYRCPLLLPYKWNNSTNGDIGEMFSSQMFAGMNKLVNISSMFYFIVIPANVIVPVEFVVDCINLQDISQLFLAADFQSTAAQAQQIDDNTFAKNVNLKNISYAFASGQSQGDWSARSPKKISSTLFNANKHKQLTNVTGLFYNATTTTGSVPEFWNWLNSLSAANRANVFYAMRKANLTNGNSVPSGWDTGMV